MRRPYHIPLFPEVPWTTAMDDEGDFAVLTQHVLQRLGQADRSCLDRWLLILDQSRRAGYSVPSLLDLGCSSGIFSILARLSLSNQVTAVDDASALIAGYGHESVLDGLKSTSEALGIHDIEASPLSVPHFLRGSAEAGRTWDIVLCLGLLHHLVRGYGDLAVNSGLDDLQFDALLQDLGACTKNALWIEVDETRIGDPTLFFQRIVEQTGLIGSTVGLTCSGPGRPRQLMCFLRNAPRP